MIGKCVIPLLFWRQMQTAPHILLRRNTETRIERLCTDYHMASNEDLKQALHNISKRLGREKIQQALQALSVESRDRFAAICLMYYDRQYDRSEEKRKGAPVMDIDLDVQPHVEAVEILKNLKVSWSSIE